ncbi:sensor histidine kinase [Enterococcus sp. LJL128]
MDNNVIRIALILILSAITVLFFMMRLYYRKRENKLIDVLQEMVDSSMNGKFSDITFDETKCSYLENSLKHYVLAKEASVLKLEKQKEAVHMLITDISHQSAVPISNILLYTELITEQVDSCSNELSIVKEQAQKLDFLIQSLVKTARLETDMITINSKKENINLILQAIGQQFTSSAKKKAVKLTIEPTSVTAEVDLKWTIEAVSNIVDNAIKYTPKGGNVTIRVIPYQMFARIDVIDTGIGISEEEQGKIFSRFYRSLDVENSDGIGVGLYLARKIIQMEQGYIKVKSAKGSGSTFSIFLLL